MSHAEGGTVHQTSQEVRSTPTLAGRHAVVTGGSRGIGAAIATALARLGARITVMGRTHETAERRADELTTRCGVDAIGVPCDVSDERSIAEAFATARERFGAPYILVNNAGEGGTAPFGGTSRALWDRMLAVNLTGTFLCTQQVLPDMLAARAGRIINIASTAGLKGYSRIAAYCAAKHGVVGLTRALAVETAKAGVTVNAVCPGYTETDMARQGIQNLMTGRGISEAEAIAMLVKGSPRGVLTQPDEVADAVVWLCSPHAGAITGQAIAVAGGEVM